MALVLALEDDRLSQRLIEKVFKNAGHDVYLADSIKAGLECLKKVPLIDLVVLDSHLGTDHGWDFVAEIRRRPVFRQLPIIVYTGYTERQEVLRYAALKVQAVHVKPIKADVLLAELERATRGGGRSQVLEDHDETCVRLKLDRAEYAALLVAATEHLEEDRALVARNVNSANGALSAAVDRLKQRARELGIRQLDETIDLVAEQARRGDRLDAVESLAVVSAVVGGVRQRAVEMLGTSRAITGDAAPLGPAVARADATAPDALPSHHLGALTRRLLNQPFWSYASILDRLPSAGLTVEQLEQTVAAVAEPGGPVEVWLEAMEAIESIPRLDLPDVAKLLEGIDGFRPACGRIVERMTLAAENPEPEMSMLTAATRLGVVPAVVLAAVARVVRAPMVSPLELQPLRQHAAASALLAFELARLFKVAEADQIGAAVLAHQFGFWCCAYMEPGLTALALAATSRGVPLGRAVEDTFGVSPQALGQRLIHPRVAMPVCREAAGARLPTDDRDVLGVSVPLAIIFLSEALARAAAAEDQQELAILGTRLLQADHPAWTSLRSGGVTLPRDMKEFVDAALKLASTFNWIAREAAG